MTGAALNSVPTPPHTGAKDASGPVVASPPSGATGSSGSAAAPLVSPQSSGTTGPVSPDLFKAAGVAAKATPVDTALKKSSTISSPSSTGRKKSGREPSMPIANIASSSVNAGGTAAIINGGKVAGNGQLRGTVKEKQVPQASSSNSFGFGWFSVLLLGLVGVGVAYVWIRKRNISARYRYQGIPSNAGNFYDDDDDEWGSSPPKVDGGHVRRRSRSQSSDHDILVDTADFDDDDFGDDFDDDLESELRR
jgi:hypothetical protein